jgi:hypothetical protein
MKREILLEWETRKELFGANRPAPTLVEVSHQVDPQALLEVAAMAYLRK